MNMLPTAVTTNSITSIASSLSDYSDYVLAEIRCAVLRAKLLQNDLTAIGIALKGRLISADDGVNMNKPEFKVAYASELQAMYENTLRQQRAEYGAAPTTIEALMFSLRSRGSAALAEASTQRRLADLSLAQVRQVIDRLIRLRTQYPAIDDKLLVKLKELLP